MIGTNSRVKLTAARIAAFKCQDGKTQSFLWDTDAPSLAVRATPTGRKTYVFENRLHGKTLRLTIGDCKSWPLAEARAEGIRLTMVVNGGGDPRAIKRQMETQQLAQQVSNTALSTTVGEAWTVYIKERTPLWGTLHLKDHERLAREGGIKAKRGTRGRGFTIPGPLHPLMSMPLNDLTPSVIVAWAAKEAKTRPTPARLSWRLLRAFLTWCSEHPQYTAIVSTQNPAKTRRAREALGKAGVKQDALMREQLPSWFSAVRSIENPAISAYLQTLLITGARPGEVLSIRWEDLDTTWRALTIRDKVEGERAIPLTPYVQSLISNLPRNGEWVFASDFRFPGKPIKPISKPHRAHVTACEAVQIKGLTFHGLRRSFKSLTEWLEVPAGVVAQIQGHKPSATAEKHYTVRPLDLLRVHHERIEAWILEQAGIEISSSAAPGTIRP